MEHLADLVTILHRPLGCFTVAEAHRFAVQKGFTTVAITIALPPTIIAAAIFATR